MRRVLGLAGALLWLAAVASGAELEPAPPGLDAADLIRQVQTRLRSEASYMEASVRIMARRTDRLELRFRSWDDRQNRRTFIEVLSPSKEAGTRFLRLGPNVWAHGPRDQGSRRISSEQIPKRWMGTHFTNDDMLHVSSEVEEYRHRVLGVDRHPEWAPVSTAYVVESVPREGSSAPWSRIVTWVDTGAGTPLRVDYYDADGAHERELRFEDLREVQGRRYPHRWRMIRRDKQARESILEVREIRFDQRLDAAIFTTGHLRKDG